MAKILILGAGNAQYDVIKWCKENGHTVHACSYTDTDKSIPLCDEFKLINITDIDGVEEYARSIKADTVYSVGSDIAMPTVMEVSKRMGLKYFVEPETAHACNIKYIFREKLGNDFTGNLEFHIATSKDDLKEIRRFPVIMKPVDSQGQRGVVKCYTLDELEKNFESSISHSRLGKLIIEEFIDGEEVSLNVFMKDGEMVYSRLSDRISFKNLPGGIIREHLVPSKYENTEVIDRVNSVAMNALLKMGILNGPAYFQIMISNGRPYIIEITPRLDGCHMWNLLYHYEHIDLLAMTMSLLLENKLPEQKQIVTNDKMKLEFVCQEPDTPVRAETISPDSSSLYQRYYYKENDNVRKLNGYMEKCGYRIKKVNNGLCQLY